MLFDVGLKRQTERPGQTRILTDGKVTGNFATHSGNKKRECCVEIPVRVAWPGSRSGGGDRAGIGAAETRNHSGPGPGDKSSGAGRPDTDSQWALMPLAAESFKFQPRGYCCTDHVDQFVHEFFFFEAASAQSLNLYTSSSLNITKKDIKP